MHSEFKLRGDLTVVLRKDSAVLRRITIRNQIVNGGLSAVLQLLAQNGGPTLSDFQLKYLRAGTGSTAPAASNTGLDSGSGSGVKTVTLTDSNRTLQLSAPFELRVTTSIDGSELPGVTLREAGLVLANGTLFARQIHPGITLGAGLAADYDWRLTLTAVNE